MGVAQWYVYYLCSFGHVVAPLPEPIVTVFCLMSLCMQPIKYLANYSSHAVAYPRARRLIMLYPSTPPAKSEHIGRMVMQT